MLHVEKRGRRGLAVGAALLGLLPLAERTAHAQTATPSQPAGFQVNRYSPTAAGEYSFAVEHPWFSATRYFAAGVTLNYAHNPLLLGLSSGESFNQTQVLVGNLLIAHLDFAGSFLDRILVTASLPVTLYESGDIASGAALGDPRIGVIGRIWGQPYRTPFSVSLGANLWIPLRAINSDLSPTSSDLSVRFEPKAIFGGLWKRLLWSATLGFLYRGDGRADTSKLAVQVPPDNAGTVGSELQIGAAVSYYDAARRISVGPELTVGIGVTGPNKLSRYGTSLEALIGGNYNVAKLVQVGLAAGLGFIRDPGTPDARVLLRVAYAPIRKLQKDADGDGIPDSDDACPMEKGLRTGDPATNGCPKVVSDRDHDGVPDERDRCPDRPQGSTPDPLRPGCPGLTEKPAPQPPADRDGDGVNDKDDACPDVPKGAQPDPDPVRRGCPAQDSDKDGVIDPQDQCLFDPAGLFPDPARPGCPLPDRDGDGIPDPNDACPDKAGAPSPFPKRNGCPGLVEVKNGQIMILKPVFFATDKDTILPKSYPVLQAVADAMEAVPSIKRVVIEGHTDNQGKAEKNLDLSERRAKSVLKYLLSRSIEPVRLVAKGIGPARPIASNKTAAGRAKNRRVEFHIVETPESEGKPESTDKPSASSTEKPAAPPAAAKEK
jgi:outer membrane protein OmpA-like peptidoglycan-associated protein